MSLDTSITAIAPATLRDHTRESLIVPRLQQIDTAGIVNELSQALQREGCVADLLPFYQAALNRELLANSGMACGLAFPHARLSGVKQLQFAFGRTEAPIIWGPRGSCKVDLVFLLAVPATDAASYLHLLATLARLGQQPDVLSALRAAPDAERILSLLEQVKLRPG
jgi:mannitol/fructose-specific phosphotransferase system IIA component (Ntr-type)